MSEEFSRLAHESYILQGADPAEARPTGDTGRGGARDGEAYDGENENENQVLRPYNAYLERTKQKSTKEAGERFRNRSVEEKQKDEDFMGTKRVLDPTGRATKKAHQKRREMMKSLRREEESAVLYGSNWARLEKDLQAARKRSMDRAKNEREKKNEYSQCRKQRKVIEALQTR